MTARLWLDAHDYGARLLRGGEEPWLQPSALGLYYAELSGLLHPQRLVVPFEPLLLPGLPDTADALMRSRALDAVVASEAFQQRLSAGLTALTHSPTAGICVPRLPGPCALARGVADEDSVDDIVSVLGQLLRQIAAATLCGTVLIEEPEASAVDAIAPLLRIAEHASVELRVVGSDLVTVEWEGLSVGMAEPEVLTVVPVDAQPEAVLGRLAAFGE